MTGADEGGGRMRVAMRGLGRSFGYAFAGIGYLFRSQRNARIHAGAATGVLGLGLWLGLPARDWAVLVLTIGKVFLHDLGELEDLYRVASLVGLALSLILVSLAYQRFVFRKGSS